ncbi:CsbD family protein [Vacuolonema iberomarrocanum]|uniref:CsbD family protein n=1 Tax=Vacuolonema iberomarrocanum TaxID=3454632 RepID=UPI0019FB473C|nr:CsbD family protein [filamentous cyanobacterium LEGE 07170]
MKINSRLSQRFGTVFSGVVRAVCCALLAVTILFGGLQTSAIAASNNALDQVAGQGTTDMIQGKAEEDLGTVKRNLGKVTGQVEGAADQAKGRARRDIGRTQNAAQNAVDETGDAVEETADDFVDSVKGLFGQ